MQPKQHPTIVSLFVIHGCLLSNVSFTIDSKDDECLFLFGSFFFFSPFPQAPHFCVPLLFHSGPEAIISKYTPNKQHFALLYRIWCNLKENDCEWSFCWEKLLYVAVVHSTLERRVETKHHCVVVGCWEKNHHNEGVPCMKEVCGPPVYPVLQ